MNILEPDSPQTRHVQYDNRAVYAWIINKDDIQLYPLSSLNNYCLFCPTFLLRPMFVSHTFMLIALIVLMIHIS